MDAALLPASLQTEDLCLRYRPALLARIEAIKVAGAVGYRIADKPRFIFLQSSTSSRAVL